MIRPRIHPTCGLSAYSASNWVQLRRAARSAYLGTVQNDGLPSRRDEHTTLGVGLVAEPVPERLEGEELVHQGCIVAFHDHSERDDEGEHDSLPPKPQALTNRHIVFILDGSIGAISHAVAHGCRFDSLGHMANTLVVKSRHGEGEKENKIILITLLRMRFEDLSSNAYTKREWTGLKRWRAPQLI
jgi:hypothetical protein